MIDGMIIAMIIFMNIDNSLGRFREYGLGIFVNIDIMKPTVIVSYI